MVNFTALKLFLDASFLMNWECETVMDSFLVFSPVYVKEQLRGCKKCLVSVVHTLLMSCADKGEDSAVARGDIDQVMSCLTMMASEKK